VWKRIGKYCDISEWLQIPAGCKITSGTDGEFGAVRTVGTEVLVGRTELSYTYAQTPKEGTPYNLYHGTLEARPVTPTTSKKKRRHRITRDKSGAAGAAPVAGLYACYWQVLGVGPHGRILGMWHGSGVRDVPGGDNSWFAAVWSRACTEGSRVFASSS
jgi:hypothetical protein